MLNAIDWMGAHFYGLFQEGGKQFVGLVSGIVPILVVLLTFMYAMVKFIGQERVNRAILFSAKYTVLRYTVMPILALLLLANPMAYTFGRFLPEYQKPAFYDSAVSFCHPITSFFPYANAGEIFVWLGVADGITKLHLSIAPLAVRYFLVGVVVILMRGILTERITRYLMGRKSAKQGTGEVTSRAPSETLGVGL